MLARRRSGFSGGRYDRSGPVLREKPLADSCGPIGTGSARGVPGAGREGEAAQCARASLGSGLGAVGLRRRGTCGAGSRGGCAGADGVRAAARELPLFWLWCMSWGLVLPGCGRGLPHASGFLVQERRRRRTKARGHSPGSIGILRPGGRETPAPRQSQRIHSAQAASRWNRASARALEPESQKRTT